MVVYFWSKAKVTVVELFPTIFFPPLHLQEFQSHYLKKLRKVIGI